MSSAGRVVGKTPRRRGRQVKLKVRRGDGVAIATSPAVGTVERRQQQDHIARLNEDAERNRYAERYGFCPQCGKPSIRARALGRYLHLDGEPTVRCWEITDSTNGQAQKYCARTGKRFEQ